jgi:2-keto-4-pentenoate hydratase/2-oxohepta-3-ene-1,7-dioic acid hydratase in catechol pathway
VLLAVVFLTGLGTCLAQTPAKVAEPFKLGTFEIDEQPKIGIVLRDSIVIELNRANSELERSPMVIKFPMPAEMKELIARYDYGLSERIYQIVNTLVEGNRLTGAQRPSYVHDVAKVRTLAPVTPISMVNVAINYYSHVNETATPEQQKAAAEERRKAPGKPYVFLKPVTSLIGNHDDILMPMDREKIDWETEIGVVMGRPAKYVSAQEARNYVFGYTMELDISDRGGRPEKPPRHGSDWFLMKGHDTFAPLGPFIVPKEFMPDISHLQQQLWVNGKLMMDGNSSDMINTVEELIEWTTNVMTLQPGDVIAAGTPSGTGQGTSQTHSEPVFLKPGDKVEAKITGIGTLNLNVKADPQARKNSSLR